MKEKERERERERERKKEKKRITTKYQLMIVAESSGAARHGGCFPAEATVRTSEGVTKRISEVEIGERVAAVDSTGSVVYSPVLLFLDRDANQRRNFVVLRTERGDQLTLTPSHLIYTIPGNDVDANDAQLVATFAHRVQIDDWIVIVGGDGRSRRQRVVDVGVAAHTGVFAPLTEEGTLVVDDVVVSCYAVVDDQSLAHWAFAPVRMWTRIRRALGLGVDHVVTSATQGVHPYAEFLYSIARTMLPSHLVYN